MKNLFKSIPDKFITNSFRVALRETLEQNGIIDRGESLSEIITSRSMSIIDELSYIFGRFNHSLYGLVIHEHLSLSSSITPDEDSGIHFLFIVDKYSLSDTLRTLAISNDSARIEVIKSLLYKNVSSSYASSSYFNTASESTTPFITFQAIKNLEARYILKSFDGEEADEEKLPDRYKYLIKKDILFSDIDSKKETIKNIFNDPAAWAVHNYFIKRLLGTIAITALIKGELREHISKALDPFLEAIFDAVAERTDDHAEKKEQFIRLSKIRMFLSDHEMMNMLNFKLSDLNDFEYKTKSGSHSYIRIIDEVAQWEKEESLENLENMLESRGLSMDWDSIISLESDNDKSRGLIESKIALLQSKDMKLRNDFMRRVIDHDIWNSHHSIRLAKYDHNLIDMPTDVLKEIAVRMSEGKGVMPVLKSKMRKKSVSDEIILSLLQDNRLTPQIMEIVGGGYEVLRKSKLPLSKELKKGMMSEDLGL